MEGHMGQGKTKNGVWAGGNATDSSGGATVEWECKVGGLLDMKKE
jgi:hypothetical protein